MAPDLMFRTRTPPVQSAQNAQFCVVAVQPSGVMTKSMGQNKPRIMPQTFVDVNGNPVHLINTTVSPTPAPVPAEKAKVVLQGDAYMSMIQTELEEEGKIEFKGKLPALPPQSERLKQSRKQENTTQSAPGITVQGDVAQCVVGLVVRSKGGISFGGGS